MQSYEFFTTPENGVISIPEQYKNKLTPRIKVVMFNQTPANPGIVGKRTDSLSPVSIDTRGWTFDKEEANGR